MRSLREAKLEAMQHQLTARRLANQPGRPNRTILLARESALHEAAAADDRFQEALEELHILDIYCLDPVQGTALIPFAQENQLAWFVYDLFNKEPLSTWRFHKDPLEMRRPIAETLAGPSASDSMMI
jgi:hypothetical protein